MRINPDQIYSPVTGKNNVSLEDKISIKDIVNNYKKLLQIDTNYIFNDLDDIYILKCLDSGYRFYYPFDLMGDEKFYTTLGNQNWYYLPWKWEHNYSLNFISEGDKVLEVGAARGDYLEKIRNEKKAFVVGLELNDEAAQMAKNSGIDILIRSIEDYSKDPDNLESYDIVCSFQVLEHLSNVKPIIQSMIDCLKPGGKLLISVPNNESYIKDNPLPSKVLNMPPHHMGLWNKESLTSLEKYFEVKLIDIAFEPLQSIHSDTYQFTILNKLFRNITLTKIYWKLRLHILGRMFLKLLSGKIKGHSIIAVYQKM